MVRGKKTFNNLRRSAMWKSILFLVTSDSFGALFVFFVVMIMVMTMMMMMMMMMIIRDEHIRSSQQKGMVEVNPVS